MKTNTPRFFALCILLHACLFHSQAQVPQLWSLIWHGGTYGNGSIFKLNGDGTGSSTLFSIHDTLGSQPYGQFTLVNKHLLFGTAQDGGANGKGVIFKYDLATQQYSKVYDFNGIDGGFPQGNLFLADNGKLFGTTSQGGTKNVGTLFRIDTLGNNFTKIYDFDSLIGGYPGGSMVRADDNNLYFVTNRGIIYNLDPSTEIVKRIFDLSHGGVNTLGFDDNGLISGIDGKLYGASFNGGLHGYGKIFSFDITSDTITSLYDFDGVNGKWSSASLVQATDGKLYGVTTMGGIHDKGVLFSYDPFHPAFLKLLDFGSSKGDNPINALMQASDGKLYGSSSSVMFSFDILNNTYAPIYNCTMNINPSTFVEVERLPSSEPSSIPGLSIDLQFQISPNPTTNSVNITIDKTLIGYTLTITDITGRKMTSIKLPTALASGETLLPIDYPNGIYFVTLSDGQQTATQKLIIQK